MYSDEYHSSVHILLQVNSSVKSLPNRLPSFINAPLHLLWFLYKWTV